MNDFGMLTFVTPALICFLAYSVMKARKRQVTGSQIISWFLIGVIALTSLFFEMRHQQIQNKATNIANSYLKNPETPVQVKCQRLMSRFFDARLTLGGYVSYDKPNIINLQWDQCRSLGSYARSSKDQPTLQHIVAMHLLTHEIMHTQGVTSEGAAECYAMQESRNIFQAYGASQSVAEAMAMRYAQEAYPHMPKPYYDNRCHKGGEYDLHKDDETGETDNDLRTFP